MNPRALRLLLVVVVLAALGTGAALLTGGHGTDAAATQTPTPTPSVYCLPLPGRAVTPAWYPKDLPLPAGSYASDFKLAQGPSVRQRAFVVPVDLRGFVQHVLSTWPAAGYVLGRGDAEVGEAEDTFRKASSNVAGAFRASSVLCDPHKTFVIIAMGVARAVAPVASPTGTASPTPLLTASTSP